MSNSGSVSVSVVSLCGISLCQFHTHQASVGIVEIVEIVMFKRKLGVVVVLFRLHIFEYCSPESIEV